MDQQGEDVAIGFGTDGWRTHHEEMTERRLRIVGHAAADYLDSEAVDGAVAIGFDGRHTSREFAMVLARVLAGRGRSVELPERDCPTPVLAWTVANGEYAAGLMVTASHNPPEYNGVKFITGTGAPALPAVTAGIEARLDSSAADRQIADEATVGQADWIGPYLDHAWSFARESTITVESEDRPLEGMTIAYDALHGSGRDVTDELLGRAGASVRRLRCEHDPTFGGVAPEPTPETAGDLVELVSAGEADLGLVNDGDADRVGVVTPERGYVDANVFLAACYEFLLESMAGDVVRTVSTSSLVDRVAADYGQQTHETPVGFKWVAERLEDTGAIFGGEESGGYGLTAHLPNKDGVLVGLLACLAEAAVPLDRRIAELFETYGTIHQTRRSLDCPNDCKEAVLDRVAGEFAPGDTIAGVSIESISTADGFKAHLEDGSWILVRPSGTEPKLRCYAEAESIDRVETLLNVGIDRLESAVAAVS